MTDSSNNATATASSELEAIMTSQMESELNSFSTPSGAYIIDPDDVFDEYDEYDDLVLCHTEQHTLYSLIKGKGGQTKDALEEITRTRIELTLIPEDEDELMKDFVDFEAIYLKSQDERNPNDMNDSNPSSNPVSDEIKGTETTEEPTLNIGSTIEVEKPNQREGQVKMRVRGHPKYRRRCIEYILFLLQHKLRLMPKTFYKTKVVRCSTKSYLTRESPPFYKFPDVTVLRVPEAACGYLTGLDGRTLKKVQDVFSVFLVFEEDPVTGERLVTKPDSAKQKICKLMVIGRIRDRLGAVFNVMKIVESLASVEKIGIKVGGEGFYIDDDKIDTSVFEPAGEFKKIMKRHPMSVMKLLEVYPREKTKTVIERATKCVLEYIGVPKNMNNNFAAANKRKGIVVFVGPKHIDARQYFGWALKCRIAELLKDPRWGSKLQDGSIIEKKNLNTEIIFHEPPLEDRDDVIQVSLVGLDADSILGNANAFLQNVSKKSGTFCMCLYKSEERLGDKYAPYISLSEPMQIRPNNASSSSSLAQLVEWQQKNTSVKTEPTAMQTEKIPEKIPDEKEVPEKKEQEKVILIFSPIKKQREYAEELIRHKIRIKAYHALPEEERKEKEMPILPENPLGKRFNAKKIIRKGNKLRVLALRLEKGLPIFVPGRGGGRGGRGGGRGGRRGGRGRGGRRGGRGRGGRGGRGRGGRGGRRGGRGGRRGGRGRGGRGGGRDRRGGGGRSFSRGPPNRRFERSRSPVRRPY